MSHLTKKKPNNSILHCIISFDGVFDEINKLTVVSVPKKNIQSLIKASLYSSLFIDDPHVSIAGYDLTKCLNIIDNVIKEMYVDDHLNRHIRDLDVLISGCILNHFGVENTDDNLSTFKASLLNIKPVNGITFSFSIDHGRLTWVQK